MASDVAESNSFESRCLLSSTVEIGRLSLLCGGEGVQRSKGIMGACLFRFQGGVMTTEGVEKGITTQQQQRENDKITATDYGASCREKHRKSISKQNGRCA